MVKINSFKFLWVANILNFFSQGAVLPTISLLLYNRGISSLEIGIFGSISSLIAIFLPLVTGSASDRIGRKSIIFISTVLIFLSTTIFPFTYGFLNLLAVFLTLQASFSIYRPLIVTWVMDEIGNKNIGLNIGRFSMGNSIGYLIGVISGGILQELFDFTSVYLPSVALLITSSIMILLANETHKKHKRQSFNISLLFSKNIALILGISFLTMITHPAYNTFLPLYIQNELQASPSIRSLAFSFATISEIPAMMYFGRLSDKIGRKKVFAICLITYSVRYLLTGLLTDPILVSISQILHGITWGGLFVTSTAYISDVTSEEIRGSAMGLRATITGIAIMTGSYSLGFVTENFGFSTMYILTAILPTLALILLPFMKKNGKKKV